MAGRSEHNPFPSPEPSASDCEISTQMAYGCTNYASNTGHALTKSVVGIIQRDDPHRSWNLECTGTIIDNQWILTSAHCVIDKATGKLIRIDYLKAAPWQSLLQSGKFGVPVSFHDINLRLYKLINIKAVYIPAAYNLNERHSRYSPDLALLKINPITPDMGLEPIPVANKSSLNEAERPVITAGYGYKENQTRDEQLRYRKNYYMTNIYDSSWFGGVSGNYGNIYISGSKPVNYKGVQSSWSFTLGGDSGGPILSYNAFTHKLQVQGVFSSSLCTSSAYFARLPFSYSSADSTTYPRNYDFIKSVMNEAYSSQVRCMGECYFKTIYVINQADDNISSYKFDNDDNLVLGKNTLTRYTPTQITFNNVDHTEFVTNYRDNSISKYKINSDSGLEKYKTKLLEPGHNGPIDIVSLSAEYIFVLAQNSDSILQYSNTLTFKYDYLTLMRPTHLNIIWIKKSKYLAVTNEREVALYKWNQAYQKLVNTAARLALTSDMGELIEIKPFGDPDNQKLYVLTTNGVYIYQPTEVNEGVIIFKFIGKFLKNFLGYNHLVPLYANSFAISERSFNRVGIYEVAQDNTIVLKNTVTMPHPVEMAFDSDILYITSITGSLYSYTISYPDLSVSVEPKIVETGRTPMIVKINKQNFSE